MMSREYYVASCLFTARFPKTSLAIQQYIAKQSRIQMVRCCIPNFRIRENAERINDGGARTTWEALPTSADFQPGDRVYSLCYNCTNILDKQHEGLQLMSLWELIDGDPDFVFPDYSGMKVTVQDCWRSRDRAQEQEAVRHLLEKMNIGYVELKDNREHTDFCGSTLFREQPAKNARYAPKHYVEQAAGKFLPHTQEEQIEEMKRYCSQFTTDTVVCYCHYCLEGLLQGGVDGRHIAHLLFPVDS